jgi:IS30 family transposase
MAVLDSAEASRLGAPGRTRLLAYRRRKAAARRAAIPGLRAQGYSVFKIATLLSAHPQTIARDIAALRREGNLP